MTWTCQRVLGGERCAHVNPGVAKKCQLCGRLRSRKRPGVREQLQGVSYEECVQLNGGEFCGVCGAGPSSDRRLHRDHDHRSGRPRGLLCFTCNRLLGKVERGGKGYGWLVRAAEYVRRSEQARTVEV